MVVQVFKTFIDLFCGLGGMRIGMERNNLRCVWASDSNKQMRNLYFENFGMRPAPDLTIFPSNEVPYADVICASIPYTKINRDANRYDYDKKDGNLFWKVLDIVRVNNPKAVVLEYPFFAGYNGGLDIGVVIKEFTELGYRTHVFHWNSKDFGMALDCERIYLLIIRSDLPVRLVKRDFSSCKSVSLTIRDLYDDVGDIDSKYFEKTDCYILEDRLLDGVSMKYSLRVGVKYKSAESGALLNHLIKAVYADYGTFPDAVMPLFTPLIYDNRLSLVRRLTTSEYLRLYGYGEVFKIGENRSNLIYTSLPKMIELLFGMLRHK